MAFKKISVSEFAPIIADYRAAFPEWQLVKSDTLVRIKGPIAQAMWFDRLRSGTYRPTCRVHILAAPGPEGGTIVLPQFLNVKIREITLKSHARALGAVLGALKSEILPSLSQQLDEHAVVELLKQKSASRPANAFALACLLAVLGASDDSVHWITEYHTAIAALGLPYQPVDAEREAFLKKVEEWLKLTEREARFAEVVENQKSRLLNS